MSLLGKSSLVVPGGMKKSGVSQMFIHQWLILHHFVSVNETKIKFTNVSEAPMECCNNCGGDYIAFNNSPGNVRRLREYIKESVQAMKRFF